MEFTVRKAVPEDVGAIMQIMEEARRDTAQSQWFAADDEDYVREHLEKKGFVVVAQKTEGGIAGFFLIKFPKGEEHLGNYLDFSPKELQETAVMDSAAVDGTCRGYGLQGRMLDFAQEQLRGMKYRHLLCTIHPDNRFSLSNMEKHGYVVQKTIFCYGGLKRYLLLKELSPEKR